MLHDLNLYFKIFPFYTWHKTNHPIFRAQTIYTTHKIHHINMHDCDVLRGTIAYRSAKSNSNLTDRTPIPTPTPKETHIHNTCQSVLKQFCLQPTRLQNCLLMNVLEYNWPRLKPTRQGKNPFLHTPATIITVISAEQSRCTEIEKEGRKAPVSRRYSLHVSIP